MNKIQMTTPIVEMDGDEMTRILWRMIKDDLLLPYIDLKTDYYDLGLEHRNETDDQADSAWYRHLLYFWGQVWKCRFCGIFPMY